MNSEEKYIEMYPSKTIVKMYYDKKLFYHALNISCIDVLDCDIPLDIGLNIQSYISEPEHRYYTLRLRIRHRVPPRFSNSRRKVRRIQFSKAPLYLKSNAGAGYR